MLQGEAYQLLPDFEGQFTADPPRIPAGRAIAQNNELLWTTVIGWIETHRKLIHKITGGLRPYFPGTAKDIRSLALLVAFEALQHCAQRGQLDLFVPTFCKRFRNSMIDHCKHVPIADGVDVEALADPNQSPYFPASWPQTLPEELKASALARMLPGQATVWRHFLEQWDPNCNCAENARRVNQSSRGYYILLNRGIGRVARKVQRGQQ